MHNDIETWRTTILASMAVGQTLFVILYLTWPWWKSFLGRALFYKSLILGTILDVGFAARYFKFLQNDQLFVVLYIFLAIGIWWQFFAFLRVKRAGRAERGVSASASGSERASHE